MISSQRNKLVTPHLRASQLPDEFNVKGNQLHCKWCNKVLISLRNDNLREHLHSRIHQENRIKNGARMSFNPDTAHMKRRRALQKKAIARRKEAMKNKKLQATHQSSQDKSKHGDTGSSSENSSGEQLSQLFEETDSEDTECFEGFENDSKVPQTTRSPPKRRGRPLKRPARLSDAFDSSTPKPKQPRKSHSTWQKKRNRSSYGDPSSSIPLRAMPLKKQMSYNARTSFPPTAAAKKGKLKIKISRQPKARSKSFQVESSEGEDSGFSNDRRVTSFKGTGDGLKMKFFIDKPPHQSGNDTSPPKGKKKSKKRRSGSAHDSSLEEHELPYGRISPELASPVEDITQDYQESDTMFEAIQDVVKEEVVQDVEVVEEEIVGVDEGEVVSWDAVIGDNLLEDLPPPSPQAPSSPELSSEQTLAIKANYAREMAKAVNSAQFKKKRLVAKRQEPLKQEDKEKAEKMKRKISGYNLWSSKMRRQVATQYPGLQFGDISKKLGNLWKKIPDKEKQMWKNRGEKTLNRVEEVQTTKRSKGSKMIETGPKKKHVSPKQTPKTLPLPAFPPHKIPELTMQRELNKLPLPTLEPIDAASHFHLLGQSLISLGNQVQTTGKDSSRMLMPMLLDGLVCSFAPLLSLVNHVPQLQGSVPESTLVDTFTNVAHIMPGF